ncbi:twin-arginine translocase subunit TatC [Desulfohalovibrio reitneri]|uniref:twin-arginine translocase subunit TatC n=1 Tax=Desulfohalovibrio reitneri TaxID=1307759 RepID=UPI0005533311|nr:twin-arginine translocase subunit TatC [Desulfohalovibrio reitneri]
MSSVSSDPREEERAGEGDTGREEPRDDSPEGGEPAGGTGSDESAPAREYPEDPSDYEDSGESAGESDQSGASRDAGGSGDEEGSSGGGDDGGDDSDGAMIQAGAGSPPDFPTDGSGSSASGDGGDGGDGDDGEEDEEEDLGSMPLVEHLKDLRNRMVRIVIAVVVGFLASWAFRKRILDVIMEPMKKVLDASEEGSTFIYTYPAEAFFTEVKACVLAGILLTSPYIFYQFWRFIAPGLYRHERLWVAPIALITAAFFAAGALFGYLVVFPFGFEFFAGFMTPYLKFLPAYSAYFSFAVKLLIAFGLVFEMPIFVFFLARMGLVTAAGMRKYRKYAILCIFLLGAVLTPPDPISQLAMAGPLIILYEVSIYVAKAFGRRKRGEQSEQPEEEGQNA